jgi:hypothetical protein
MFSNPQSTKAIVFNYGSHGSLDVAHIVNGVASTLSRVEIARGCSSRCYFIWLELLAIRRYKYFDTIKAYSYSVEAKVETFKIVAIANILPFLLTCNCAKNSSIHKKMFYPCCIWSYVPLGEQCRESSIRAISLVGSWGLIQKNYLKVHQVKRIEDMKVWFFTCIGV